MPRLIDADEAYKVLTDYYRHRTETQHEALKEAIERVPTVDAVPLEDYKSMEQTVNKLTKAIADAEPVVRRKDCEWWEREEGTDWGWCHACKHIHYSSNWEIKIQRIQKYDFYCADAERRR